MRNNINLHRSNCKKAEKTSKSQLVDAVVADRVVDRVILVEPEVEQEEYVDKLPPFFGNIETELAKEYHKFEQMFKFPLNPAFYTQTFARRPKNLKGAD